MYLSWSTTPSSEVTLVGLADTLADDGADDEENAMVALAMATSTTRSIAGDLIIL
jgi:hypothetical protein